MFESFELPPLAERTIASVLNAQAQMQPDKVAVFDRERSLTYAELLETSMKTAGAYSSHGIVRGERVLLMLDNHVDAVVAWLGLALLGAVEVPVNTSYKGQILEHLIDTSGADVLVVESNYLPQVARLKGGTSRFRRVIVRHGGVEPGGINWADIDGAGPPVLHRNAPSDIMAVNYTSGTTGPSKGVLTPEAHAYSYATPAALGAPASDDVYLVALPFFHVGGQLYGVYSSLIAGATCYIPERFSTQSFWEEVNAVGATFTMLVGAMVNFLLAQPKGPGDSDNPLRSICVAPISDATLEFMDRFGVEGCCTGYGSTESASPLSMPVGSQPLKFGLGWARPDYEAQVVDEQDMPVGRGTVGELVIRPREPWTMMSGYDQDPAKTAEVWRNLWFHTGDAVVQREEDDQFVIVDRISDSIRRRGENISSYAIETIVGQHRDIADCAAVGIDDDVSGQEVCLAVVRRRGSSITAERLSEFLVDNLPHFMVPRYIRFVDDDLPRSASGKVQKNLLRSEGVTPDVWDRAASGIVARRG